METTAVYPAAITVTTPTVPDFNEPGVPGVGGKSDTVLAGTPAVYTVVNIHVSPFTYGVFIRVLSMGGPVLGARAVHPCAVAFLVASNRSMSVHTCANVRAGRAATGDTRDAEMDKIPVPPCSFTFFSSYAPEWYTVTMLVPAPIPATVTVVEDYGKWVVRDTIDPLSRCFPAGELSAVLWETYVD